MQGQDRVSLDSDPGLRPIPTPLSIRNAPSVCVRYGLGLINFNSGRDSGVHRLPNQDKHDCYTQPPPQHTRHYYSLLRGTALERRGRPRGRDPRAAAQAG